MAKQRTVEERQLDWDQMCAEEGRLLLNKGRDYTAGQAEEDAYANFRIIADLLDDCKMTPFTVAMVYFLKHVLSVITFVKTGTQESGESLRGRFQDIRNYAFILSQLVEDHEEFFKNPVPKSMDDHEEHVKLHNLKVSEVPCWSGTLMNGEKLRIDDEGYFLDENGFRYRYESYFSTPQETRKEVTPEVQEGEIESLLKEIEEFDPDNYVPDDVVPFFHPF